ncbi:predicted protein [Postia placenta Mad-698-R]|uniref:Uncharacterized protein n=1 Tax=Postia placenta MAD-698-R-SB12 TaxID=670580 RepID=A0A1X6MJ55_9APHY|nr:hypothetical protein POSPLADRAFT_1160349 [Postia placenta MAD-698-R-SB12]EED83669.1 predicted protein [Postia placenta Mad-698-R]OSX56266.1 hypothetical protein POSPLADRAFT_1160349 [Postia placenta MAD-698-R-SB12]
MPIEIFSLIIESGSEESDSLMRVRFVLRAASVSRAWRQLVLSTPSLWTTIHVSLPYRPPITILSTMLERSRALTLDIDIDWVHPGVPYLRQPVSQDLPEPDADYIHGVMNLLTGHMVRWRSLDMCTDYDEPETNLLPLLIGTAPVLKTFRLFYEDTFLSSEEEEEDAAVDFRRFAAPHLDFLHLESLPSCEDLASAIKQFPSVTEVTWCEKLEPWLRYEGPQLMQIFEPLRALRRLNLGALGFEDWDAWPPSDTVVQTSLPALEVIEFCDTAYHIVGDILANILAPCLRQVNILDAQHVDDIGSTFQGFFNHSTRFPHLHSLVLEVSPPSIGCIPDAGSLWAVFGFFRSIRIVACEYRRCYLEDILRSLSFAHTDGWYFPRLKRLTAEAEAPGEGVTRLETLKVYGKVPIDQSAVDDLKKAVSTLKWTSGKPNWDVDKYPFGQYHSIELKPSVSPEANCDLEPERRLNWNPDSELDQEGIIRKAQSPS